MKQRNKRIIMTILLILALFTLGSKLLIEFNLLDDSENSIYNQNNNSISINSENYKKYYESKGFCDYVVDGDTIDVTGVGRIRLVGINTPERGEFGYENATDFVKNKCLGKTIYLDIDDAKNKDKYGRILAIVYVDGVGNLNEELLNRGYAEIMYIPPSEFNPYEWT